MSETNKFKTVEQYFNAQPEKTKNALLELKKCILKVQPNATELFNYNIPAYALVKDGKRQEQIMIAGYKKHVGLYPHPTTMEKFDKELSEYKKGKGTVQIKFNQEVPTDIIKKTLKSHAKLNAEKKQRLRKSTVVKNLSFTFTQIIANR